MDANGAVRLLRRDVARRALLVGRARPGTDLAGAPESEATAIAVDLALRLWRPAGAPFRWIGDHVPRWPNAGRGGPARRLVPLARDFYGSLGVVGRRTLVHGDFHHHNLFAGGSGHVAIYPKPMLGEREYHVAPFLWNPLGSHMRLDVAEQRLAAFTAAGLDERRMRAWAVIRGAYLCASSEQVDVLRALV